MTLVAARPRGMHESVWTCLGAAVLLASGAVHWSEVGEVLLAAKPSLAFLFALLLLSTLLESSGFFEWAAVRCAELAGGDARALYRNVFLLGAATTAVLSLDTTAVILTPLVLAFVGKLDLPVRPYVFACALVANTASLPLPVSNLTNLLLANAFGISAAEFALHMLLPQAVALGLTFALCRGAFRSELPATFDPRALPDAFAAVPHRGFFWASACALLAVCAGYFLAPLVSVAPYVPAFGVALALGVAGAWTGQVRLGAVLRGLNAPLFLFVVGLFVVVRAVMDLGLAKACAVALLAVAKTPALSAPVLAFSAAAASNLVNNLPAALLAETVLRDAHAPHFWVFAALLGTNIGPNLLAFGSLATMLVLARARERGAPLGALEFARVGAWMTPIVLTGALLALGLTFAGR